MLRGSRLTQAGPPGSSSVLSHVATSAEPLAVGVYDEGLISVVDEEWSRRALGSWQWLLKPTHKAVIATGFGDLFVWDKEEGVSFLEVQRLLLEPIDRDVNWFLEEFLVKPEVIADVLRRPRLAELVARLGGLPYNTAFVLRPWASLGGEDIAERYDKRDCLVYLDLVGQSGNRRDDKEEGSPREPVS